MKRLSERGIMPKEQINIPTMRAVQFDNVGLPPSDAQPHKSGEPARTNVDNFVDPVLHISWMGNEEIGMPAHMQAAMEVHRSQVIDQAKWLEENPDAGFAFFWTPELTRPEAQSLIRTTRRARDRVYGSDE